ncbi:Tenascin-X [Phytophthora citrophthora]|uniref:Tenascin-X n=1 Tax=Phytophthora citrophthora TaxID=4793 RepID=A0AAD9LJU0_9STRA|nr:Tenascin-X [Phytophthora citrophthora]
MQCFRTLAVFTSVSLSVVYADDEHPYYCTSDAYCEKNYPGTVCISVNNYGDVISKCTPNTSKRPACRGAQPGLCPSYQSADIGYLNAHCVFVSEENLSLSSSGSGSSRRRLASSSASASAESPPSSSSTSSTSEISSGSAGSSSPNSSTSDADALYTTTIDGEEVKGQFVCLDVSDCESKAADPSTCYPSACGSSDSKEQCTYQGTCTYKNKKKITKRTCMCYAGFEGDMCSTEVSNACDVDCGTGGDCVDGECVCKEGFDGKEYDGKQGKANQRCTLCTNDLACQYNNTCNIDTGKCVCAAGYSGDTCGAVEDACTTTSCGEGDCQVLTNGSAACYCPSCSPSCSLCDMLSNYTFDCSTCVTDGATATQASKLLMLASGLVALLLASFAL